MEIDEVAEKWWNESEEGEERGICGYGDYHSYGCYPGSEVGAVLPDTKCFECGGFGYMARD